MIVLITAAKYIAALLTQKTFKLSSDQRTVIFGLSSAHVAATLAAVMVATTSSSARHPTENRSVCWARAC